MPIDDQKLKNALLEMRLIILEFLVMRLHLAVGALQLQQSMPELRARLEQNLEDIAQQLEKTLLDQPSMEWLSAEERALLQDEFRELIEGMKTRLELLFPP